MGNLFPEISWELILHDEGCLIMATRKFEFCLPQTQGLLKLWKLPWYFNPLILWKVSLSLDSWKLKTAAHSGICRRCRPLLIPHRLSCPSSWNILGIRTLSEHCSTYLQMQDSNGRQCCPDSWDDLAISIPQPEDSIFIASSCKMKIGLSILVQVQ